METVGLGVKTEENNVQAERTISLITAKNLFRGCAVKSLQFPPRMFEEIGKGNLKVLAQGVKTFVTTAALVVISTMPVIASSVAVNVGPLLEDPIELRVKQIRKECEKQNISLPNMSSSEIVNYFEGVNLKTDAVIVKQKICHEKSTEYRENLSVFMDKSFGNAPKAKAIFEERLKNMSDEELYSMVEKAKPVVPKKVETMAGDFLKNKRKNGTEIEQQFYKNMTTEQFLFRLYAKRQLEFFLSSDTYITQEGVSGIPSKAKGRFEDVGTERENPPFTLATALSYEEMQIAANLSFSTPSKFYNKGDRDNQGIPGKQGTFVESGHIIGAVGARFEKPGLMEHRLCVVTDEERITPQDKLWAKQLGLKKLPNKAEAAKQEEADALAIKNGAQIEPRFIKLTNGDYLDMKVYKAIMQPRLEAILQEGNEKGAPPKEPAYVHLVGLGLGVWCNCGGKDCSDTFAKAQLEIYKELLGTGKYSNIADLDFSWFPPGISASDSEQVNVKGKTINLLYTKNDPGVKTPEKEGKTLVVVFAWDGGSFPGNEVFSDALKASGDPAAAMSSDVLIAYAALYANSK